MMRALRAYLSELSAAFGDGWNRFWFTPSDPAALSAMRLFTGLVAVYLHATLFFDFQAFFGPQGMLPTSDVALLEGGGFSYLNYLHSPTELWLAHLAGLVVLVLFAAGFGGRWIASAALIVFLSDVNRAVVITSRTEVICAMLMLYLCVGESTARYSVDRLLNRKSKAASDDTQPSTSTNIAIRLIQVHLCLLVAMTGFSMLAGSPWWTGDGVWWLATREESRLIDFTWLHAYPKLVDAWTHKLVAFQLAFPILIWVRLARPLVLAAGAFAWISLSLLTGETTFAIIMLTASLAFVRPELIESCVASLSRTRVAAWQSASTKS